MAVAEGTEAATLQMEIELLTEQLDRQRRAAFTESSEKRRGVAIGRKNHYGSRAERGLEVAALMYTLIESAKLAGVDPAAYLRKATLRAIANPGTVTLPNVLRSG